MAVIWFFKIYYLVSCYSSYKQVVDELHGQHLKNSVLLTVWSESHKLLLSGVFTGTQRQQTRAGVERTGDFCASGPTWVLGGPAPQCQGSFWQDLLQLLPVFQPVGLPHLH